MTALLYYEFKRAIRIMISSAAGLIITAALLAGVFLCVKALLPQKNYSAVSVGIVYGEDELLADTLKMVENLKSVRQVCSLEKMDEKTGTELLKEGRLAALLVFPEDFVRRVASGENPPLKIYVPENGSLTEKYLEKLLRIACSYIQTAETGVYSAYLAGEYLTVNPEIGHLGNYVAAMYAENWLRRDRYFEESVVIQNTNLKKETALRLLAGLTAVLAVGLRFSYLYEKEERSIEEYLKHRGIGHFERNLSRLAVVLVFCIITSVIAGLLLDNNLETILAEGLLVTLTIHLIFSVKGMIPRRFFSVIGFVIVFLVTLMLSGAGSACQEEMRVGAFARDEAGKEFLNNFSKSERDLKVQLFEDEKELRTALAEGSVDSAVIAAGDFETKLEKRKRAFEIISGSLMPGSSVVREAVYAGIFTRECMQTLLDAAPDMYTDSDKTGLEQLFRDKMEMVMRAGYVFRPDIHHVVRQENEAERPVSDSIQCVAIIMISAVIIYAGRGRVYEDWHKAVELMRRNTFGLRIIPAIKEAGLMLAAAGLARLVASQSVIPGAEVCLRLIAGMLFTALETILVTYVIKKKELYTAFFPANTCLTALVVTGLIMR